jgi:hypothetical protein
MPVKKKPKVAEAAPLIDDDTLSLVTAGTAAEHVQDTEESVRVIKSKWSGIEDALPLGIAEGGTMAPYCPMLCDQALKASGKYMCGINLMWLDQNDNGTRGVPVLKSGITELETASFTTPAHLSVPHILQFLPCDPWGPPT